MPVLTIGATAIPYVVRRNELTRRRTIAIGRDEVVVTVPSADADADVEAFVHRKRRWLFDRVREVGTRATARTTIVHFATGAKIPYRGRHVRLSVRHGDLRETAVAYRNGGFLVTLPEWVSEAGHDDVVETALRLWLRKKVRDDAAAFIRRHGPANGLKAKGLHVKEQKHLWGSCGHDGIVNLNWHLIFAPKSILEYAVVHELCHLRYRAHGVDFWTLVGTILPDWEARKAWLDRNQHLLGFDRVQVATAPVAQVRLHR